MNREEIVSLLRTGIAAQTCSECERDSAIFVRCGRGSCDAEYRLMAEAADMLEAPQAEELPQSLLPGLLEAKRIVDSADTWEQVRRQLHGTIRNAQEDEAAPPTPFPTALAEGFGDPETLLNSRDWLTKAVVAKGAEVTGGGCGCGQADIDIKLEGCDFNVSIKPIIRSV